MTRNSDDVVVGVAGAVLGTVLLVGALKIPTDSNAFSVIGPRGAPLAISIGMILCSLAILWTGLWSRREPTPEAPIEGADHADHRRASAPPESAGVAVTEQATEPDTEPRFGGRAMVTVALFTAYLAVLIPVGYILSTFAFLMAMTTYVEPRKVVRNLVYAVVFSVVVYYLFGSVLQVQLPRGILG